MPVLASESYIKHLFCFWFAFKAERPTPNKYKTLYKLYKPVLMLFMLLDFRGIEIHIQLFIFNELTQQT
jgi:hypothetical protein